MKGGERRKKKKKKWKKAEKQIKPNLIDSGVPLMIIQILPRAMWDGSQLLLLGWQVMAEKKEGGGVPSL